MSCLDHAENLSSGILKPVPESFKPGSRTARENFRFANLGQIRLQKQSRDLFYPFSYLEYKMFSRLKVTVIVIVSDPPCKDRNAQFAMTLEVLIFVNFLIVSFKQDMQEPREK